VKEYTTEFKKMEIMLGISPKNPDILLKYLGIYIVIFKSKLCSSNQGPLMSSMCKVFGHLHSHFQKQMMLLKSRTIDELYVRSQYLENIGHKKGQLSGINRNTIKIIPRRRRRSGKEKIGR
jgi:hypothetical protein